MEEIKVNMESHISHIQFKHCILNASGPRCTEFTELKSLDNSLSGGVVTKSATLSKREGNVSPRYYGNELGSINSMGLPNKGVDFYIRTSKSISKPYIISVSGLTLEDNKEIIKRILVSVVKNNSKIDGLEINLSCPNIIGKGQLGYNFEEMELFLKTIFEIIEKYRNEHSKPRGINTRNRKIQKFPIIGIKLPPYFELNHFKIVSKIISNYPLDFITCINSIGNGLIVNYETEETYIKPKDGIGGIGGVYVKPTGLSNVRNFYLEFQKLKLKTKIIGCGGIKNGTDIFEYILCGADIVQIGTQFYEENTKCFERLIDEFNKILNIKKYKSLDDFKGKLKTIN